MTLYWLGIYAAVGVTSFCAGFLFAAMMSQRPLGSLPTEWEPQTETKADRLQRWKQYERRYGKFPQPPPIGGSSSTSTKTGTPER